MRENRKKVEKTEKTEKVEKTTTHVNFENNWLSVRLSGYFYRLKKSRHFIFRHQTRNAAKKLHPKTL